MSLISHSHFAFRLLRRGAAVCSLALLLFLLPDTFEQAQAQAQETQPNILIILADDLGWADLGFMGSEISTPVIDDLANRGITMSSFYVAPLCAPSRAMLMTGLENHEAGVGTQRGIWAENQRELSHYDGSLQENAVTLAEMFKASGYQTFMSGKWHIGFDEASYPHSRGFDRSFALLEGGASHFADAAPLFKDSTTTYLEDGVPASLPPDFYSTISYTDKLLEYLSNRDRDRPFLAYAAYTAPHDPLQVPDEWIDRYEGVYDEGPEAIRRARYDNLVAQRLLPKTASAAQFLEFPFLLPTAGRPWQNGSEEEQQHAAKPMEIYASMIELMDKEIGRIIDYLKAVGELDNTLILFLSDNGASAASPLSYPGSDRDWLLQERDMSVDNIGRVNSHTFLGADWAFAANGGLKHFKVTTSEGGIRAPFIVAGPGIPASGYLHTPAHITDIAPTLYDAANINWQSSDIYADKQVPGGQSMMGLWQGEEASERVMIGELLGNRYVRKGDWKLVSITPPFGNGKWQLFNIATDPGEQLDVQETHPEIVEELESLYAAYAERVGVVDPDPAFVPNIRSAYVGPCNLLCETRYAIADIFVSPAARNTALGIFIIVASLVFGFIRARR